MSNSKNKNTNNAIADPLLEKRDSYSIERELCSHEYPKSFTGIPDKVIKSVSMYLQLLWTANSNGKTIKIFDVLSILTNAKNLFSGKYETKDVYIIRHVASDLREISLFNGFDMKKYFKNIDIERSDIRERLELSGLITIYFSTIVHFNYTSGYNSYKKAKGISKKIGSLNISMVEIPDNQQDYLKKQTFENVFEQISIMFVMNYYEIFSEFLFNDAN